MAGEGMVAKGLKAHSGKGVKLIPARRFSADETPQRLGGEELSLSAGGCSELLETA